MHLLPTGKKSTAIFLRWIEKNTIVFWYRNKYLNDLNLIKRKGGSGKIK